MQIIHHRRTGNIKTYLYNTGHFSCNCQEFKESGLHCQHSKSLIADRVQAQADEVAIYKSEVLKENK